MCGIVGAISKWDNGFFGKQEETFFQMLWADAVRGMDSTGVVGVTRDGGFHIAKEAADPSWVIPQIKAEKFFTDFMSASKATGKAWIGHNRKSTVGKTTDENAHPFVINDEFAFVHNGTLYNHKNLADTEVDSQALATVFHKAMGQEDWKTAMEETLGKVFGAYACVWYDQRKEKLYLLRNDQRPLSLIETPNAYYWCSEPAMAWWILTRNEYKFDECKHIAIKEHVLMELSLKETNKSLTMTELTPKKAPPPAKNKAGGNNTATTTNSGAKTEPVIRAVTESGTTTKKGGAELSKFQLKAFRRAHVGEYIRFYVDDYVECDVSKSFQKGQTTDLYLLGDAENILLDHQVHARVDMAPLGISDPHRVFAACWMGKVTSISYDKKAKTLDIDVEGAKPVSRAVVDAPKPPFPANPYTPAKKTETLHLTKSAIEERVEKLEREFNTRGLETERAVTPTGKICLFNKVTKEKLYESAIALH